MLIINTVNAGGGMALFVTLAEAQRRRGAEAQRAQRKEI